MKTNHRKFFFHFLHLTFEHVPLIQWFIQPPHPTNPPFGAVPTNGGHNLIARAGMAGGHLGDQVDTNVSIFLSVCPYELIRMATLEMLVRSMQLFSTVLSIYSLHSLFLLRALSPTAHAFHLCCARCARYFLHTQLHERLGGESSANVFKTRHILGNLVGTLHGETCPHRQPINWALEPPLMQLESNLKQGEPQVPSELPYFFIHTLCCRSALPHTTVCGSALYKGGGRTYL